MFATNKGQTNNFAAGPSCRQAFIHASIHSSIHSYTHCKPRLLHFERFEKKRPMVMLATHIRCKVSAGITNIGGKPLFFLHRRSRYIRETMKRKIRYLLAFTLAMRSLYNPQDNTITDHVSCYFQPRFRNANCPRAAGTDSSPAVTAPTTARATAPATHGRGSQPRQPAFHSATPTGHHPNQIVIPVPAATRKPACSIGRMLAISGMTTIAPRPAAPSASLISSRSYTV